jgi:hypothetical protein
VGELRRDTAPGRRHPAATLAMVAVGAAGTGAALAGCGAAGPAPGDRTWLELAGEPQQRVVARQLRGLDVAMIEIDHRYSELYFAAQDGNWDYAEHQVEHMQLAMDLALERRPHRAPNARAIFDPALARVEAAIEAADPSAFAEAFENLRTACNACHAAEGEASLMVGTPSQRRTNIGAPARPRER